MSIAETNQNFNVQCSSCGSSIDLNDVVIQQIVENERERITRELMKQQKDSFKAKEESIRKELNSRIEIAEKELSEKTTKLEELLTVSLENETLKRNLTLIQKENQLELERYKSEWELNHLAELEKSISSKYEIKLAEKDKQIAEVKKAASDAARKADQGSMQLQGEAQENAIYNWLLKSCPLDTIYNVKTGANGADVLQTINEFEHEGCGTIYYESKNTKDWNNAWIPKLKKDMKDKDIDLGVIVTNIYPRGMSRMGLIDGIYVCSFEEFKGLSLVLRNLIIEIYRSRLLSENVIDKKEMLYEYLTSQRFLSTIEEIVRSYTEMTIDLDKEEKNARKSFDKRRSLLRIAQLGIISIHTNFSSIAGSKIGNIQELELESDPTLTKSLN